MWGKCFISNKKVSLFLFFLVSPFLIFTGSSQIQAQGKDAPKGLKIGVSGGRISTVLDLTDVIMPPQSQASPSETPAGTAKTDSPPTVTTGNSTSTVPVAPPEVTAAASPSAGFTTDQKPKDRSISVPGPATVNLSPSPESNSAQNKGKTDVPQIARPYIHVIDPVLRTVSGRIYGTQSLPEGVSLLTITVSLFYLTTGLWLLQPDLFKFMSHSRSVRKEVRKRSPGGSIRLRYG